MASPMRQQNCPETRGELRSLIRDDGFGNMTKKCSNSLAVCLAVGNLGRQMSSFGKNDSYYHKNDCVTFRGRHPVTKSREMWDQGQ